MACTLTWAKAGLGRIRSSNGRFTITQSTGRGQRYIVTDAESAYDYDATSQRTAKAWSCARAAGKSVNESNQAAEVQVTRARR